MGVSPSATTSIIASEFGVIDEPPGIADTPNATKLPDGQGRLIFNDVHFFYPDGRAGLRGLSFTAEPGLTMALVGASGAGRIVDQIIAIGAGRLD